MAEYALRLENGKDTAPRVRLGDAVALFPNGPLNARNGLRAGGGGVVSVVDGSMAVQVTPFSGWVDGGASDAQGGYPFVSDATKTLPISAGDATMARVDTVVAEVQDNNYDGSGATVASVHVVEGIPGAGAPALPTSCVPLRDVNVPAGASAGLGGLSSSNLGADRRSWTVAAGGILPVGGVVERDQLTTYAGMAVFREDTGDLQTFDGASWHTFQAVPIADNLVGTVTAYSDWTVTECRAARYGALVTITGAATYKGVTLNGDSNGNVSNSNIMSGIPAAYQPPSDTPLFCTFAGAHAGNGLARPGGTLLLAAIYPNNSLVSGDNMQFSASFVANA